MKLRLKIMMLIWASLLGGCIMLSSSEVSVKELVVVEKGDKRVTFLNNTPYLADMSVALSEYGFEVMPIPSQQQILEIRNDTQLSKYNEAAARWGLTLSAKYSGGSCVFTDFHVYHFTLMLTDITNNQIVMVLKQKGSDGPCSSVKPVFDTLSQKLAEKW
jgi:hypothetical protein